MGERFTQCPVKRKRVHSFLHTCTYCRVFRCSFTHQPGSCNATPDTKLLKYVWFNPNVLATRHKMPIMTMSVLPGCDARILYMPLAGSWEKMWRSKENRNCFICRPACVCKYHPSQFDKGSFLRKMSVTAH